MIVRMLALLVAAFALLPARADSTATPTPRFDLERPEIKAFLDEVAQRNDISRPKLAKLLRTAQPQPKIVELISKPAERVTPWWEYRDRFITDERITMGVEFWRQHRESLERIAAERGVAPEYLVAIIGVETKFGRIMGRYRVLDALDALMHAGGPHPQGTGGGRRRCRDRDGRTPPVLAALPSYVASQAGRPEHPRGWRCGPEAGRCLTCPRSGVIIVGNA